MTIRLLDHRIVGSGTKTTIVLHGLLGTKRNLGRLASDLKRSMQDHSFVLADLTGHGDSPPLPPHPTLSSMAEDVIGLAEALDATWPISVIGHSLGGRVALSALARHPNRIDKVAMLDIGPGPIPSSLAGEAVMSHLREAPANFPSRRNASDFFISRGLPKPLANWMALNLITRAGQVEWRVDRQAIATLHANQRGEDLWGAAEEFGETGRIACIRGGASDYVSDEDASRLRSLGIRIETIPGAGHFLHIDSPQALCRILSGGSETPFI